MNRVESINTLADYSAIMRPQEVLAQPAGVPPFEIAEGRYLVRFARTREEIDAALRLRFEVFNLELGEGLAASFAAGRDVDEFDEVCHHLIVLDADANRVVGTYRCQTGEMAAAKGFYSASEFDLSRLPADVLRDAVELGRACVAQSHRNTQVLFLLWKGLAAYVTANRKRYLFGCCSLTSQDEGEGRRAFELLKQQGHLHTAFSVTPKAGLECRGDDLMAGEAAEVRIPKLFNIYLRFGARVCGPPAIDRLFKTIDFLVLFDAQEMTAQWRKAFFGA
ncbi:MAG TPA: GNAT family N-acyltransferase [Blastocatellia bacterium]|nr:GNAT family N-acyltransferase [Blastocatellia bacterium]